MHTHVFYLPRSILSHNPPLCCPPTPCPPPTAWLRSSAVAGQRPLPHALHRSHHLHQCNPHSWSGCREHHGHCQQMYVCMWVCQNMLARVCVCMCVCECVCVFSVCCYCQHVWVSLSECVHEWMCECICECVSMDVVSLVLLCSSSPNPLSPLSLSVWAVWVFASLVLTLPFSLSLSHPLAFSLLLAFFRCPSLSLCLPCSLSLGLLHCLSWPAFQQRDQWAKRKRKKDRKKRKSRDLLAKVNGELKMCLLSPCISFTLCASLTFYLLQ